MNALMVSCTFDLVLNLKADRGLARNSVSILHFSFTNAFSVIVFNLVSSNSENPGAQSSVFSKIRQIPPGRYQNFLHEIFNHVRARKQTISNKRIDPVRAERNELGRRLAIFAQYGGDQLDLVAFGRFFSVWDVRQRFHCLMIMRCTAVSIVVSKPSIPLVGRKHGSGGER